MSALPSHTDDLHQSTERLERALIGSVLTVGLLSKTTLAPEDFLLHSHRVAWAAILRVAARGDAPNLILLGHELALTDKVQASGGPVYLASCLDSTDCSALGSYARLVKEAARLRKMRRVGGRSAIAG